MKKLFLLLFLSSCTGLFYHPDSYLYSDPGQLKFTYEDLKIKSRDGTELALWYFKSTKKIEKNSLILFFHGNAQNMSSHYYNLAWILKEGHDFIVFDYRGYGISEGKPSPQGVKKDALTLLHFAHQKFIEGHYKHFIVYGQSLGGVILLNALEDFKNQEDLSLAIFDSTFLSYQKLAKAKLQSSFITYLFSPLAKLLVSDEGSGELYAPKFKRPALVIHGKEDPVIPFGFGEEFYTKLGSSKKDFWPLEKGGHIDIFSSEGGEAQKKFLNYLKDL